MSEITPQIPGGCILLARNILESELMNKPPHYLKLWVWMLCKAFWKNGNKLKRGQFHATIEEMQEACSYRVGYRVYRPSVKEIRDAYESFTKGRMIGRMKGTRGMVITICNYEYYQSLENYEGHNEGHDGGNAKGTGKMKKNNNNLKPYSDFFEILWKEYPSNEGKRAALEYFNKTVKCEADCKRIRKALDNYLLMLKQEAGRGFNRSPKNGSTWFNNWSDWENWEPQTVYQQPKKLELVI